jgi:hypothetical protein
MCGTSRSLLHRAHFTDQICDSMHNLERKINIIESCHLTISMRQNTSCQGDSGLYLGSDHLKLSDKRMLLDDGAAGE